MTITIEWGWWVLPAWITVFSGCLAAYANRMNGSVTGMFDGIFDVMTWVVVCVVPSLIAWLVWAVLR